MDKDTDIARKRFIFKKNPSGSLAGQLVEVDVQELDKAWKGSPNYIEAGGKGAIIGNRYSESRKFLQQNTLIYASEVLVKPNCSVEFSDGRHRFCSLRDAGRKKVVVQMRGWQYWYFRHLLKPWWQFWRSSRWLRQLWYTLKWHLKKLLRHIYY